MKQAYIINLTLRSPERVLGNPASVLHLTLGRCVHTSSHENLSDFVPEEVEEIVAESGDHEVRTGDCSGTKTDLERSHVADKNDKGELRDEGEVGNVILEALLGERKGSGLANEEVHHLAAHD